MPLSSVLNDGLSSPAETAAGQILIVDDDPEIRDVLRKILHAAKYHVDEAATAEDGLRKLRERQPDHR